MNSITEGELSVPDSDQFSSGHWDGTAETYTRRFGFNTTGAFETYSRIISMFDDRVGSGTDSATIYANDTASLKNLEIRARTSVSDGAGISLFANDDPTNPGVLSLLTNGAVQVKILGDGSIFMPTLPTSDPVVADQLWNDAGTMKISTG